MSGEGKGRIAHLEGKYVFSYESLFKNKEKEWLLGLSLPIHGEEVLTLGFRDADKSKVQVKGRFFKRLTLNAKREGKQKEIAQLKKVLGKIAVFLKVVDMVRIGDYSCKKGTCGFGKGLSFKFKETKDELNIVFPFDKNHEFFINAKNNSTYYRKVNFTLKDKRRSSMSRQPFALTLIQRDCS